MISRAKGWCKNNIQESALAFRNNKVTDCDIDFNNQFNMLHVFSRVLELFNFKKYIQILVK